MTYAQSLLWRLPMSVESGNAKLLKWALKLQSYDIEQMKGRNNIVADCLSRSALRNFRRRRLLRVDIEYSKQSC